MTVQFLEFKSGLFTSFRRRSHENKFCFQRFKGRHVLYNGRLQQCNRWHFVRNEMTSEVTFAAIRRLQRRPNSKICLGVLANELNIFYIFQRIKWKLMFHFFAFLKEPLTLIFFIFHFFSRSSSTSMRALAHRRAGSVLVTHPNHVSSLFIARLQVSNQDLLDKPWPFFMITSIIEDY
jgi:hypothetical protein